MDLETALGKEGKVVKGLFHVHAKDIGSRQLPQLRRMTVIKAFAACRLILAQNVLSLGHIVINVADRLQLQKKRGALA